MYQLREAARYSYFALGVYEQYQDALMAAGLIVGGRSGVYHPDLWIKEQNSDTDKKLSLDSSFRLTDFDLPEVSIVYGSFSNDTLATPYCILVDQAHEVVVISIRGTASLEDMVTDLQFSSSKMNRVGEVCGFDGSEMHAHRGILTKSKYIFNDLKR